MRDFLRSSFVSDNKTFCIVFDWETYTQWSHVYIYRNKNRIKIYVDFVDTLVISTIFKDSESDSENEKKKSKPSKQSSKPSGSNFFVNFFWIGGKIRSNIWRPLPVF